MVAFMNLFFAVILGITLAVLGLTFGSPDYIDPPKQRTQVVFEATCGDRVLIVYQPVNTMGIQYDEKGRKISGLQNCTAVPIGRAEKLGAEVTYE